MGLQLCLRIPHTRDLELPFFTVFREFLGGLNREVRIFNKFPIRVRAAGASFDDGKQTQFPLPFFS